MSNIIKKKKKRRVVAIIQARMTSKRFPGKSAALLMGTPVLAHVLHRARVIPGIDAVVCAFPDSEASISIVGIIKNVCGVGAYAGDEADVLGRYYEAAKEAKADVVVRITGDCPLIDPLLCGKVIELFHRDDLDYASNIYPKRTFPKGLDCEVFSFDLLELANAVADDDYDREHVTPWMQRHSEINIGSLTSKENNSHIDYCVDEYRDIKRLEKIIKDHLGNDEERKH